MTSPNGHTTMSQRQASRALVRNPAIYEIAAQLPPEKGCSGPARYHPNHAYVLFCGLLSVFSSAVRTAEALRDGVWDDLRDEAMRAWPDDQKRWLPAKPITLNQWNHVKRKYLKDRANLEAMIERFAETAAGQAKDLGLLQPGAGSATHPSVFNTIAGDGVAIRQLSSRYTARGFKTGTGEWVPGNNIVHFSVRGDDPHCRVILDFDAVRAGAEADTATQVLDRVLGRNPGVEVVVYDGAFKGKHLAWLIREWGVIGISPPASDKQPWVLGRFPVSGGRHQDAMLVAHAGRLMVEVIRFDGESELLPLTRVKLAWRPNADSHRLYGDFELPVAAGGGRILGIQFHAIDEDQAKGFNRAENLRPIPKGDDEYQTYYGRRNDAEAINRVLKDTLWGRRAHSKDTEGVLLDFLGFGLLINSTAIDIHGP